MVFFNKVTGNFFIDHSFDYFCSVQGEFLFLAMRGITPPTTVPLTIFFSYSTTGEELNRIDIAEFAKKCNGDKWDDVLIHKDSRLNKYDCFYPNFPYKITIVQNFQEQLSCEQCRFVIYPKCPKSSTTSTSTTSSTSTSLVSPDAPENPWGTAPELGVVGSCDRYVNYPHLILFTYPYLQYLKTGIISIISDVCSERKCMSYVKPGFCKGLFGSSKFVTFLHYNSISKLHTINFEEKEPITSKNMFDVLSGDVGTKRCSSHLLYHGRVFDRDKHGEFLSGVSTFESFDSGSSQEREKTEPVFSIIDTADIQAQSPMGTQTGVAIKYMGYGMFKHYVSIAASSSSYAVHNERATNDDRASTVYGGRRAMIEADMAFARDLSRANEERERARERGGERVVPFAITTPNPSIQAPQNPTRDGNGRVVRPPTYGLSRTAANNRNTGERNVYNGVGDTVGGGGRCGEIGTIVLFRLRRETYHVLVGVLKDVHLPDYPENSIGMRECCSTEDIEYEDVEDNIYAYSHRGRYSGGNLSNGEWKIVGTIKSTFEELKKRHKEIEKELL